MNEALARYAAVVPGNRAYSAATWKAHASRLEIMRLWLTERTCQPDLYLEDVDEELISAWFRTQRPPRYAPDSSNNFRQYAKQFFTYCVAKGWMQFDPMLNIRPVAAVKRVRLRLTAAEMLQILEDATPRDRIALAVGQNILLRAQDVMMLTIGNMMVDTGFAAAWVEKNDTELELPISKELRAELLRWMEHYAFESGLVTADGTGDIAALPNDWYLIPPVQYLALNPNDPTGPGRRVYDPKRHIKHPEKIVHRALVKLGHPTKGEGFHTLRRSAARAVFDVAEADKDKSASSIRITQAFLGHKNQATTEIYLGLESDRQALNKLIRGKSFLTRAAELDRDRNAVERAEHAQDDNIRRIGTDG